MMAQELDKDFFIYCNDVTYSRIDRIIAKCDFYYDCISGYEDISDSQFELLEKWIESGIEETKKAILNYIDSLTDYDQDYYLETWLDCYGDTYATDNTFIYELTVKKYA